MKNLAVYIFCLFPFISSAQFTWQHTDGPFGSLLSFIYSNDKYAFIPADDFLFRSANGISWEKLEYPVSIEMSTYGDTIVNLLKNTTLDTIFLQLSFDNGESWIVKKLPESFLYSTDIRMCSHGIYISSNSDKTLARSTDHGDSWTNVNTPIVPFKVLAFDERLYLFSGNKLWRTNQSGETWENITPDPLLLESISDLVAKDSNIIFSTSRWFFASHDNGMTWEKTRKAESNNLFTLALVEEEIYAVVVSDLLRSIDFGTTWDTVTTSDLVSDLGSFAGINNTFLGTSFNKGVFRWDEAAQTLTESNYGLSKGYVYDLAAGDEKIWAACGNGVFAYDIPSESWSDKMDLPLPENEFDFISANDHGWVLAAEFQNRDFYLSKDNGITWDTIQIPANLVNYMDRLQMIDETLYLFKGNYVYHSADQGLHWDLIDDVYVNTEIINCNGKLYMAGVNVLYTSSDNGIIWNYSLLAFDISELYSSQGLLYAFVRDPDNVPSVYISSDGVQWNDAGNEFPDNYAGHTLFQSHNSFFFKDAENYYAFLKWQGHYVSPANSFLWSPLPASQTGNSYVIHNNVLYLGGSGVYKSAIENPYITAVKEADKKDVDGLFTISPNPVKDQITITSDPTKNSCGTITIYAADGKMVTSTQVDASQKSIEIPVANFPSGLYYVMLQTEAGRAIRSFIK